MKLFRSIFWLSIAFLAIGPQVNAVDAVSELSRQTLSGGSQVIAGQIEQIECEDLTCVGGKAAASATLRMLPNQPQTESSTGLPPDNIPFPRPRLDRA